MPLAKKILPNYTYEEYCQWEGKWELIDGIPFAMTPAPTFNHQLIAARINLEFGNLLKSCQGPCEVCHPVDIKINEHTVVQPDVLIVCTEVQAMYLDFPPELVVEILSPSTREKDLITKHELYCSFGIKYYVIVDPEDQKVTIYLLENKRYIKLVPPFELVLHEKCHINPDFAGIFPPYKR